MAILAGCFRKFRNFKALCIGDYMIDAYTRGEVSRISPEAPICVVHVQSEEQRIGGAGNVALNLLDLGATVSAFGRVGKDLSGDKLRKQLYQKGVLTSGMIAQEDYQTPVKNRILSGTQQMLRLDYENPSPLPKDVLARAKVLFDHLLKTVEIIAISDYAKGFLPRELLQYIIRKAREENIPTIIDPKGIDYSRYERANIIKPNKKEAYLAAKLPFSSPIEEVAERLFDDTLADQLIITRSEEGISLFDRDGNHELFPITAKEVIDVTGAGDTVLAMLTCCIANGLSLREAVQLANVAAGISVETVGCGSVSLSSLAKALLENDIDNKVFDEEQLFALQKILEKRRFVVLGLNLEQGFHSDIFRAIHKVRSEHEGELIVYLRDKDPKEEMVHVLAQLADIDFIVLKKESLHHLVEMIQAQKIFVLEGSELQSLETVISI